MAYFQIKYFAKQIKIENVLYFQHPQRSGDSSRGRRRFGSRQQRQGLPQAGSQQKKGIRQAGAQVWGGSGANIFVWRILHLRSSPKPCG